MIATLLLPVLGKILPYILLVVGLLAVYFGVKRKGAREAVQKFEKAQTVAIEKRTEEVKEAVSKDAAIDKKVGEQIDAIRKIQNDPTTVNPGDIFKF